MVSKKALVGAKGKVVAITWIDSGLTSLNEMAHPDELGLCERTTIGMLVNVCNAKKSPKKSYLTIATDILEGGVVSDFTNIALNCVTGLKTFKEAKK